MQLQYALHVSIDLLISSKHRFRQVPVAFSEFGCLSMSSGSVGKILRGCGAGLMQVIRPMFSNPPRHGAAIVVEVLSDPSLYAEWRVSLFL